ncbi:MAG: Phosphoenolpyruvate synthase [uncultured Chloroflexi bacterium]|uniref:Phosphoenolpyruvate synthase n=1 Tax=uncultured Chloroflexota bacterium TaxID=166587 RepID=A0A6J4K9Z2_9CHLR|nr:MAG: Phosphoenolpyruvate synthase [uncultured Chloroflexota bacterium]
MTMTSQPVAAPAAVRDAPATPPADVPVIDVTQVIQWLDAAAAGAVLGGKAGPLTRLAAAGLPVPPGFVITPEAFEGGDLQRDVREAIARAYAELGQRAGAARDTGDAEPLVAVRSSGTAEDLAEASFAGQYETVLGVRGTEAVVAAALHCWASLHAPHAARYRQSVEERTGRTLPPPAMAVLVQLLVSADAAGVAFTADPLSGDRSCVTLNAAWGLGQSVVDGEVEADTWQVDRETKLTLRQTTGHKPTRTGAGPDAPREAVPDALQRRPCLLPNQVTQVVELTLHAEAVLGVPADVEWAVEGERAWLLQARPITTGVAEVTTTAAPAAVAPVPNAGLESHAEGPTPDFPFSWPDAEAPRLHWKRQGDQPDQPVPAPMRPLSVDVYHAFQRTWANSGRLRGGDTLPRSIVLNGIGYSTRASNPMPEAEREAQKQLFERAALALHDRGETYLQTVVFPEVDAANERLAAVDVWTAEPAALAAHFEEALRWYERAWTLHWMWGPNGPKERFQKLYAELTGDKREESAAELLGHEPNLLTDAIDGLVELARIAQSHAPLRALLLELSAAEALVAVRGDVDGAAEFCTALDALLERQGLRCGEGYGNDRDEMLPGWREDPSLVIELVQRYVPQDLDAMAAARAAAIARRDARAAEIRASITDEAKLRDFDFWLTAARKAQQGFEDHNYKIDSAATSLLHLAIAGSGRRLAAAGVLAAESDIWWLHAQEAPLALRGLIPPAAPDRAPDWPQLVEARKALQRWQETLTPPEALGAPPPPPEQKPDAATDTKSDGDAAAEEKPAPPENVLITGQTGSLGVATGRVRLVDRNTAVPHAEAGDVLVAHNAGPAWTPLFPMVAAVVLDAGAFFQHAMLTCREYGVPAVFQTKEATKVLRDGQRVTVDATHGWVLPAPPATPVLPEPPAD